MTAISNPQFEVWSTVAWDGKESLLAANLHFDRMERHANRLNFRFQKILEKIFLENYLNLILQRYL